MTCTKRHSLDERSVETWQCRRKMKAHSVDIAIDVYLWYKFTCGELQILSSLWSIISSCHVSSHLFHFKLFWQKCLRQMCGGMESNSEHSLSSNVYVANVPTCVVISSHLRSYKVNIFCHSSMDCPLFLHGGCLVLCGNWPVLCVVRLQPYQFC